MDKRQFEEEIWKIQKFMWLDIWKIQVNLIEIDSSDLAEWQKVNWEIVDINYTYFIANINFDLSLLEEKYDEAIHVIFHEFSHIYTSNTIEQFEEDREHYEHCMWPLNYIHFKNKYNNTNEQQTELLARRFHILYINSK